MIRWRSALLVVQALPTAEIMRLERLEALKEGTIIVGYTATKRLGGAVVRNRAKRRLRAVSRAVLAPIKTPAPGFIFIATTGTLTADYATLLAEAQRAINVLIPKILSIK
ncbi:MAG: ribonuclease P protein component [Holosporales bacterium]